MGHKIQFRRFSAAALFLLAVGCTQQTNTNHRGPVTAATHTWFPIQTGEHAVGNVVDNQPISCASCHDATGTTFKDFSCLNCHLHRQALTDRLHGPTANYRYTSEGCYSCHSDGARVPYDHPGIENNCRQCHDVGMDFAALPKAGFTHPGMSGADCGSCHVKTTWEGGAVAPNNSFDPAKSLTVAALMPTWNNTTIVAVTGNSQTLNMVMNHTTTQLPAAALANCAGCHDGAAAGNLYPGRFHGKLAGLGVPQPTNCLECHSATLPKGFVGPIATSPVREPSTGEMQHDAFLWANGARTTTSAVPTTDCSVCHIVPVGTGTPGWNQARSGSEPSAFHDALLTANIAQPNSCLDCHANSRPNGVLTSANAALVANLSFDHTAPATLADCTACHVQDGASPWTSWEGGKYHLAGSTPPSTCLPCHADQRPTSTAAWTSTTYQDTPFDYVTNARGNHHGDDLDCAVCHAATSGSSQSWAGGHFTHGPTTPSATTCIACHTTQRPDLQPGADPTAVAALIHYDHATSGTGDCFGCHQATVTGNRYANYLPIPGGDWRGALAYPSDAFDPAKAVTVESLIPTYGGTSITQVTPQTQMLQMHMDHTTNQVEPGVMTECITCHEHSAAGMYFPGDLHSSLANVDKPQPTTCNGCHRLSQPVGFVGPLATMPARTPATGEMKHNAVAWANRARTTTPLVTADCGVCHTHPAAVDGGLGTWSTHATYHPALTAAGQPQPASCLDCHANSRPDGVLTSANAALPANVEFDHSLNAALADCNTCHNNGGATQWTSWTKGQYHPAGSAAPTTCLPCHAGERPTSTSGWQSTTYQNTPFDYGTNDRGVTHGAGLDCVTCHANPGTGMWGSTHNWAAGRFTHDPAPAPGSPSCIACHMSQRPDLQPGTTPAAMATLLNFDHAANGTGDCQGCHQATVTANNYANYFNPVTHMLPNGDWKGGVGYPGTALVAAPGQFVTVTEINLQRSAPNNLVRSSSSIMATLHNAMLHISPSVPAQVSAGTEADPDYAACWHCHQHNAGTVTTFADGRFHASLTAYSATPNGTVSAIPQPTSRCNDCHAQMRPTGIVEKSGSNLQPMDHNALFKTPVTLGGVSTSGVAGMDCSLCHASPGTTWGDGRFHNKIGAAVAQDCTVCHYPLMADTAKADVTNTTHFAMKHASAQMTFQNCLTCHTTSHTASATSVLMSTSFQGGKLHPNVTLQPSTCNECHTVSVPASGASTQGSVVYVLPLGGTATNGGQWMNHGSNDVVGKDCSVCHAADAKTVGSAWSKAAPFHAKVPNPLACQGCHGLTNGKGTVVGTNNNLPTGLTNSTQTTTTTSAPGMGTKDQISHSDINVSGHDCNFCHTQVGPSTAPAIMGKEWAQASFHSHFTGATALVINQTTGRCSNCHSALKPNATFTEFDHTGIGTQDCSACHSWPGTGTTTNANWEGATAMPPFLSVGGFTIPVPPATAANTTQAGINNLPHPTPGVGVMCSACHTGGIGGRKAIGYDHASTLINTNCNSCHEAAPAAGGTGFNDLLGTLWKGGTTVSAANAVAFPGDSRPYTLTGVTPSFKGNTRACNLANHYYPTDCKECHTKPTGITVAKTGAAYVTGWKFKHSEGAPMTKPATCNKCHAGVCNIPD